MYIMKQKQTHIYSKQTNGYQWGEGSKEGQDWGRDPQVPTTMYKINKLQGYILQQEEDYS